MNSMYKLFLDDIRTPLGVSLFSSNPLYKHDNWVIVRTYNEFVKIITERGLPLLVSFDHDLADFNNNIEKTGYDCAKWLVNYCIDNNLDLPDYLVHSWNNVGSKNITSYIENYKKHQKNDQKS